MLQLELLWRINCIDREMNNISRMMKDRELYKRINEIKESYSIIKKTMDGESEEILKNNNEAKKLNEELGQLDSKLKDDDKRLYQNGQSMKTIENIQKEIKGFKGRIDEIENRLLKLMDINESIGVQTEGRKRELSQYRDEMEKLKNKYIENNDKCTKEMEKLKLKREEIKKEIDTKLMQQYDDIVSKKSCAVSKVIDGACTECGVKLNAMLYDAVKKNGSMCLCDHCGRILYLE